MRSNVGTDQAEGLRRLLLRNHTQVIAIVAGKSGAGDTGMTINLAAAMAHSGKEVLVLDERHAHNNLLDGLGSYARYDVLDVVHEKCTLSEAVVSMRGFSGLSIGRAIYSLGQLNPAELHRLEVALTEVSIGTDVMLVNAAIFAGQAEASSSLASGVSLLVVVDATTSGITDSYALIKRMAFENAHLQFEIVVNKVASEEAAMIVFNNMAKVAQRNLAARLEYLGCIPHDIRLKQANRLGKPVVEVFPAAASAKSYLQLSQKLLHLPGQQIEGGGGMRMIIQNLRVQVSQSLRQYSKKVAHVVN